MDIAFLILFGLVALVAGGDMMVRGASDLALRAGLSPLVIGLTLVGFGTSTPELVTSLQAAFLGSPGIAIGNVVGSNTANILLILGLGALLAPIAVVRSAFVRDGSALAISALMCLGAVLYGQLTPVIGAVFVLGLIAYVMFTLRKEQQVPAATGQIVNEPVGPLHGSIWRDLALVVAGLALTILGARFLVAGAIDIAEAFRVSEAVIGLTIVAVGTSLPELVTTIVAARRGKSEIAFGNIVGSNIFNVLFILGATALIQPIEVPSSIAGFDIWIMIIATAFLIMIAAMRGCISRLAGGFFLTGYVAYTAWLISLATH